MTTSERAEELRAAIEHTIVAHSEYPKRPKNAIRFYDMATPYAIHPIWCAMTLLTETRLPDRVRHVGYQALLWHDTLEDTKLGLPDDVDPEVKRLVEEMTFDSFYDEMRFVWDRSDVCKLLKLYDKVSNLLDGAWMPRHKWNVYVDHTTKLSRFVEQNFGELNIVKLARAMCVRK